MFVGFAWMLMLLPAPGFARQVYATDRSEVLMRSRAARGR